MFVSFLQRSKSALLVTASCDTQRPSAVAVNRLSPLYSKPKTIVEGCCRDGHAHAPDGRAGQATANPSSKYKVSAPIRRNRSVGVTVFELTVHGLGNFGERQTRTPNQIKGFLQGGPSR